MESNSSNKAMSREEELQQAAEEWADYYKHAEDLCDYISIRVAYKELLLLVKDTKFESKSQPSITSFI